MKVYSRCAMIAAIIAISLSQVQAQDYYASAYTADEDSVTLRGNLDDCDGCSICEPACCDNGETLHALDCADVGCEDASYCDPCQNCGCCETCSGCTLCPAVQFWVDATFLRFHKTDGVNVGNSDQGVVNEENAELGYSVSPRMNLRIYNTNGMYWQVSYFEFNHGTLLSANDIGSHLGVRVWTLDTVTGERFMLNRAWTIDWNAGARMYNYDETAVDRDEIANGNTEFNFDHTWGIGGIASLEASRQLGRGWSLYGGVRLGIIHGDHTQIWNRDGAGVINRRKIDNNFIHTEIFTGLEYSSYMMGGIEVIGKVGWEWISYEDATSQFTSPTLVESSRTAGADAGFGGYTVSLGFYR